MTFKERLAELRAKSNAAYLRAQDLEAIAKKMTVERTERVVRDHAGQKLTLGDLPQFQALVKRLASRRNE